MDIPLTASYSTIAARQQLAPHHACNTKTKASLSGDRRSEKTTSPPVLTERNRMTATWTQICHQIIITKSFKDRAVCVPSLYLSRANTPGSACRLS